jgi:uncharacterized membrane protein YhaH (DUF805 family)
MWGWVLYCFRNYAVFKGRASRPEYWWFYLFTAIGNIAIHVVVLARSALESVVELLWGILAEGVTSGRGAALPGAK